MTVLRRSAKLQLANENEVEKKLTTTTVSKIQTSVAASDTVSKNELRSGVGGHKDKKETRLQARLDFRKVACWKWTCDFSQDKNIEFNSSKLNQVKATSRYKNKSIKSHQNQPQILYKKVS